MDITGRKPDFKDVQFVKLTYFHHEYLDPLIYSQKDEADCEFEASRINRTSRTQILEMTNESQGCTMMSLLKSRMWYYHFQSIADDIHEQNTFDIDPYGDNNHVHTLCANEWITPIRYEVLRMKA